MRQPELINCFHFAGLRSLWSRNVLVAELGFAFVSTVDMLNWWHGDVFWLFCIVLSP